jgi:bacteriorhodopsin
VEDKIEKRPATYVLLVVTLYVLIILHIFCIVELKTDKFAFFLVSLVFVLLLLPYLTYIKIFDLVELRKEVKALKSEVEKLSAFSLKKK